MQGNGALAVADVLIDVVERCTGQDAVLMNGGTEVAAAPQFVIQPTGFETRYIRSQLIAALTAAQ